MKALIGKAINNVVLIERYDGAQTGDELSEHLVTYQSKFSIDNLFGRGTLEEIRPYGQGTKLVDDPVQRKHQRASMHNMEDFTRLKNESVHDVKEDRINTEEEYATKSGHSFKRPVNAFTDDGWRPDEMFVVMKGTGDWAGRMIWKRLVHDEWVDIDPDVIMIREHPEMAKDYFRRLHGDTEEDTEDKKKKKRKSSKRKKTEEVVDTIMDDFDDTTDEANDDTTPDMFDFDDGGSIDGDSEYED